MSAGVISAPGGLVNSQFHGFFWSSANNATARTFSNVSLGLPSSDRQLNVGLITTNGSTFSTMTVGGVSVPRIAGVFEGTSNTQLRIDQFRLENYDTATSQEDIVVTIPATSNGVGIAVWTTRRNSSVTDDLAADVWDSSLPANTEEIDLVENGVVYAIAAADGASGTGENILTEFETDFDNYYASNDNLNVWGGRLFPTSDQTNFVAAEGGLTGTQWMYFLTSIGVE